MQSYAFVLLAVAVAAIGASPVVQRDFEDLSLPRGVQRLYKSNYTWGSENRGAQVRADAKWSVCGGDKSIIIHKLSIPSVLTLPGSAPVDIDIELLRDFENFALDLTIERKVGFWIDIPCVEGKGSCFYNDVCQLAADGDQGIISALEQAGLSICPFLEGRIAASTTINLPEITATGGGLIDGNYRLTVKLFKFPATAIKTLHLCFNAEIQLKTL